MLKYKIPQIVTLIRYQHPVDVVDVGKRRYACLVRHEERQQA